jgi:acyl-coenzyme A synthetase/AMP-(fatty) acid ligase
MTVFWADDLRDVHISYAELAAELTERDERHPVVYTDDPSEVVIEILLAVLTEGDLTLLDAAFLEETLTALGYGTDVRSETEPVPTVGVDDPAEIPSRIDDADDQWTLTLHTSGTTGTPTPVDQTLETLTRSVRRDERFGDHVWAFAYNPTHIAGLQVLFQAVLNRNPMVYVFEQSGERIGESIDRYGITHVSATPTFYRLRLQRLSGTYETVVRLTAGGERFEPSLRESLLESFPNAEFRNVYALTEGGSLLETDGEVFRIPDDRADQLAITEENELIVHTSLLARSVAENIDGEWFHTGDVVEYIDGDGFRFVGRESEFVNVGGYRVNPHDVERRLNDVDGVDVAVVIARESSVTGRILVAEVQPAEDLDPEVVKRRAKDAVSDLERWKQPRVIEAVDRIDQSRTGKRVRNG